MATGSLESLLGSLMEDPIKQLLFRYQAIAINQKLERIYLSCTLAAEGYFSVEAQIHRRFELSFVPELALIVKNLGVSAGWQLDQKVSATLSKKSVSSPPKTITAMLDRLWQLSSRKEPTIGVDIFGEGKDRTVVVYIPGTQSFSFGDSGNPLDMQSNILAMGSQGSAASERAVILAMEQAGVISSDEVIFVGHSQGGMVAANIASHPSGFIAAGLITFGAPIAQVSLRKVPVMAIEHVNDPVPNLSGKANPLSRNWVSVQRSSAKGESDALIHSHSLKSYRNTSELVDSSTRSGVRNIRMKIMSCFSGLKAGINKEFVIAREF